MSSGSRRVAVVVAGCLSVVGVLAPATASGASQGNCLSQFISANAGPGFGQAVAEEQAQLHPFGRTEVSQFAHSRDC